MLLGNSSFMSGRLQWPGASGLRSPRSGMGGHFRACRLAQCSDQLEDSPGVREVSTTMAVQPPLPIGSDS